MSICDLNHLKQIICTGQCLLGIDFGTKTIGLSISDEFLIIASPLKTLSRSIFTKDLKLLTDIIYKFNVGGLIIGLPLNLNGQEGPRCQSTRQFAKNILNHLDIPITFWDERFSTAVINKMLIAEVDMSRQKRKKVIDKIAATYILQGALDSLSLKK